MKKGDRVKLTIHAIRYKLRKKGREHWRDRQGVAISVTGKYVRVLWDGRTSHEFHPLKAIEVVTSNDA